MCWNLWHWLHIVIIIISGLQNYAMHSLMLMTSCICFKGTIKDDPDGFSTFEQLMSKFNLLHCVLHYTFVLKYSTREVDNKWIARLSSRSSDFRVPWQPFYRISNTFSCNFANLYGTFKYSLFWYFRIECAVLFVEDIFPNPGKMYCI